jgi:ABC-type uncharacterized transport system auxiliary subunit
MKKILSMVCVLAMAGSIAACETAQKEVDSYNAQKSAERAEVRSEAELRAARSSRITEQRTYDASQRK